MAVGHCFVSRLVLIAGFALSSLAFSSPAQSQAIPDYLCQPSTNPQLIKPDGTVMGQQVFLSQPTETSDSNASLYAGSSDEDLLPKRIGLRDQPDGQYSNGAMIFLVKGERAAIFLRDGSVVPCAINPAAVTARTARPGRALGTIVRSGPGTDFERVTQLNQGAEISILEDTGETFRNRNWFRISANGQEGFAWGGTICATTDQPVAGLVYPCP